MTETKKRLASPDIVKGMAILGVLVAHIYMTPQNGSSPVNSSVPTELLYMVLMAFLVISGYFYRPRGFVYNVKRRIAKLAVVYVACTLLLPFLLYGYFCVRGFDVDFTDSYLYCLKALIGNNCVLDPMSEPYTNKYLCVTTLGYYFVNLVIVASIVFYAVADRLLSDRRSTFIGIAVLVALSAVITTFTPIHLPFQIELVPLTVAFMVFGAYLGRMRFVEDLEDKGLRNRNLWILMAGSIIAAAVVIIVFPVGIGFHCAYFGEYDGWSAFPYFVAGCLVTVFTIGLAVVLSRIPGISTFFRFLGEHTLAILLLHCTIAKMLGYLVSDEFRHNYFPVLDLPTSLVVTFATALIASFIGKYANAYVGRLASSHGKTNEAR